MIADQLKRIQEHIVSICSRVGRDPSGITLVGVTKFADVPAVNDALQAGLLDIAENKVQLAKEKFSKIDFGGRPVKRHMIGHLQTNKVKDALTLFDLIQSVDSVRLADEIEKRAAMMGKETDILLQLDIAQEDQKFGFPLVELDAVMGHLASLKHVRTLGLMAMAPLTEDMAAIRAVFRQGKGIFERLGAEWPGHDRIQMKHLSMGMSHDYGIAIEEGANMVRIGSAIFK